MSFTDFFKKNKQIVIIVVVIVVVVLIYQFLWDKTPSQRHAMSHLNPFAGVLNSCLEPINQKKIVDEFNKKLNEINTCNCRDICTNINKK